MTKTYTEAERTLNLGIEVELKKLGKVAVKELSLENIIQLGGDLALVFQIFGTDGETGRKLMTEKQPLLLLAKILASPQFRIVVQKIAAASTDRSVEDFQDLGISDWMRWLAAFKQVMNWEELKELFLQVIPAETLKGFFQNPNRVTMESQD